MGLAGLPTLLLALWGVVALAVAAPLVLPRPSLALGLLLVVVVSSITDVVGYVGPASLYLGALAAAVIALGIALRRGHLALPSSPVFLAALLFLVTRAASVPVATDPARAVGVVREEAKDLVLLVVVVTLVAAAPRLRPVVAAPVLTLAVLAGLTVVQEFVLGNGTTLHGLANVPLPSELPGLRGRHSGPELDVNFWARTLLLQVPFALSLAAVARGSRRLIWALSAVLLAAGIYLTQSRGGMLALAVTVLVWALLYLRDVRKVALGVAALAVVAVVVAPGLALRLSSLGSVGSEGPGADQSLIDRAAVQRVGWAMVREHPVLGVGAGNFQAAQPDYRRRLAPELSQITAPHNVYLEMTAEGGIVGLGGWLALYGTVLVCGVRALRRLRAADGRAPPSTATLLTAAGLSALAGWAAASVVLHLADFPILLTIMGLVCGLEVQTRRLPQPAPLRRPALRAMGVRALSAAAAVLLLFGVGTAVRHSRPPHSVVSYRLLVAPVAAGSDAYVYDVLSRPPTVATVAALFREPGVRAAAVRAAGVDARDHDVRIVQSGSGADFTVQVSGRSQRDAGALATAMVRTVSRLVNRPGGLYTLQQQPW